MRGRSARGVFVSGSFGKRWHAQACALALIVRIPGRMPRACVLIRRHQSVFLILSGRDWSLPQYYRGTSLTRNIIPLGSYCRTMPRAPKGLCLGPCGGPRGGGAVSYEPGSPVNSYESQSDYPQCMVLRFQRGCRDISAHQENSPFIVQKNVQTVPARPILLTENILNYGHCTRTGVPRSQETAPP